MNARTKKFALLGLVLCLAFVGGSYGAYKAYKSIRQTRLVKKAKEYVEKSKDRSALLYLQRALRYNGNDVEACRLMAQLSERNASQSALIWREKVVRLRPDSLDDRLALVQTAMRFRDYSIATNALEGASAKDKQTAAYHNIAGTVATSARLLALAEQHFSEAARLEPTNPAPQLNLAIVRLYNTNSPATGQARASLQGLSLNPTNGNVACIALRELIGDSLRNRRYGDALGLSGRLIAHTNSTFQDRVIRLEVLRECNSPDLNAYLGQSQRDASTNVQHTHDLAMWQMGSRGAPETLQWLQSLPEETRTNTTICLLIADGLTRAQQWPLLESTLKPQQWGEMEFLRHAFLSRSLQGQSMAGAAKGEWELTLKNASANPGALAILCRVALVWGWDAEAEELLWTVFNRYPDQKWAAQSLYEMLYRTGRTKTMLTLLKEQLRRNPSGLMVMNNLAALALLCDAQEYKPHELAQQVYAKAPTNAVFASTYAFSLYLQKKPREAFKVMQAVPPKDLENPAIAGYYGLILKDVGDASRATTYLNWSLNWADQKKGTLLEEERRLFEQARAGT